MDHFLRKVIENRAIESDLRSTFEVLRGKVLCEVCHGSLVPGRKVAAKGGGFKTETDKRCFDCLEVTQWTPNPHPLSFIPEDIQRDPRPVKFVCHNCGDPVNAQERGPIAKFCATKPECAKARKTWQNGVKRRGEVKELLSLTPKVRAEVLHQICETPGCGAQVRRSRVTKLIDPKCFKCRGGRQRWHKLQRDKERTEPPRPPARLHEYSRTMKAKAHDEVVERLIRERTEAVEAERKRTENGVKREEELKLDPEVQATMREFAPKWAYPEEAPPAAKLPEVPAAESDAKESADQDRPGDGQLTGANMGEAAAVAETKNGMRNYDGWVPIVDVARIEARTSGLGVGVARKLKLETKDIVTAKHPHAVARCIRNIDVPDLRKALSEVQRRKSRHGSPEERLAVAQGHEVGKLTPDNATRHTKNGVAKVHREPPVKVKAKARVKRKVRRAARHAAVPPDLGASVPPPDFDAFSKGLVSKVIARAEKLEEEAKKLQAKALHLRAAAKLLSKS